MERSNFAHLSDAQYENVITLANIFGVDALQSMLTSDVAQHGVCLDQFALMVEQQSQMQVLAAQERAQMGIHEAQSAVSWHGNTLWTTLVSPKIRPLDRMHL